MEIKQILCNPKNYRSYRKDRIKYLVIHYTAGIGDTAEGNGKYFATHDTNDTSAHYFVDENSIVQSVPDEACAFHCGAKSYKHPECRNDNSIGIEMCSDKDARGNYIITEATVNNAIKLTKHLMEKYNIDTNHILRHYDVTGKLCPEPWVRDESKWIAFKNKLEESIMTYEQFKEYMNKYLDELSKLEPSDWSKEAREWAEGIGLIKGDNFGNKQYKSFCTREQIVTFLERYDKLRKR